jgi:hypothetical protein
MLCLATGILAGCGGGGNGSSAGSGLSALSKPADTTTDSSTDASATASTKEPVTNQKALDASWTRVANEGQSFTVPSSTVVQYGSGTVFATATLSGSVVCGNAVFGDPIPGVPKSCYVQTTAAGATTTPTTTAAAPASGTKLASEGGSFTLAAATIVSYGSDPKWVQKTLSGTVVCSNATFGSDPYPFIGKNCYSQGAAATSPVLTAPTPTPTPTPTTTPTTTTAPAASAEIAVEGASFTVAASTVVSFGAGTRWVQKTVSGTGQCTNAFFGSDPAPYTPKGCYVVPGGTTTPVTSPVVTPPVVVTPPATTTPTTTTPTAGDVVDSAGNVSAAAYRSMAAKLSLDEGIAYRYGAPSSVGNSGLPTWPQPGSFKLPAPYSETGVNPSYQVGGPVNSAFNDYSSNQAQAAYVADNPSARTGVSFIETLAMRFNTFTQSPGLSWTAYGVGLDDPNALAYKANLPVALGRCYGRPTWCVNTLMAFQSGLLGTSGTNTSIGKNTAQLEAGLVPTAVAVTNGGEFGLVTVWDTVNLRGRLAVIALSDKDDGNWKGVVLPGLPNFGNWNFMKIIGYVDLPGMAAPTDVSVTTGVHPENMHRIVGIPGFPDFAESIDVDLRVESQRQSFGAGGSNANTYAQSGIAVVTSKSEKKAVFVDLKPLFAYYRNTYFTGRANFDNAVNNVGQAASQWPTSFSAAPSQTPTVIKTVTFANKPTAVKVGLYDTKNAWIATEDGTLHVFSLGAYGTSAGGTNPGDIAEVGSVAVGKNPTHIAYDKHNIGGSVLVVSRAERKIDWVSFAGNGGSVVRTLRDTRMVDPITAEDNENHGTVSSVVTVADYTGRQFSNYRYGPVIFNTNWGGACAPPGGCGVSGSDVSALERKAEFGGSFVVPGKAFHVTGANVP